jgi:DNA-binding LacI/PurR family transcriptional regulator/anti-anti-sigma regulatory factor
MHHRSIGVIVPRLEGDYFSLVVRGIHEAARAHGYELLTIVARPSEIVETGVARERVDGWLAVAFTEGIDKIAPPGMPIVTVAAIAPEASYPAAMPNNHGGMYAAVQHLIEHGHRRIAFVGNLANMDVQQRLTGYTDALNAASIDVDPELIYRIEINTEVGGRAAAQRFLAANRPASAIVAATDNIAIGVMEILQASSVRIPDDVAIASFDDIDRAQHTTPPLTTVRQQPDAVGYVAAERLIAWIEGGTASSEVSYVPTALIVRRSCGCDSGNDNFSFPMANLITTSFGRDVIIEQLVRIALHPLPLAEGRDPVAVWPGAGSLADELVAALRSYSTPSLERLDQAWAQATEFTFSLETLSAMYAVLDRAVHAYLLSHPDDPGARTSAERFLDAARLSMLRTRIARELALAHFFEATAHRNYAMSMRLLGANTQTAASLDWLSETPVTAGCFGIWVESKRSTPRFLQVAGVYTATAVVEDDAVEQYPASLFPPVQLLSETTRNGGPDIVLLLRVRTEQRDWGFLALCAPIDNQLVGETMTMWARLLGSSLERAALLTSLTEQQTNLQLAYNEAEALADTVRELGSPVIPLLPGILLVPLVGGVDARRAQQITASVLTAIQDQQANVVLIDITGIPIVDAHVANSLMQTAQAATLLGARVLLAGMKPEIAQHIVSLGLNLGQIETHGSLAAALQHLLRKRSA